jgi:hypothetical protein
MANIVIKELLASDKVNEIVDKINFNFDQLLLNGGGPIGLKGGPGIQGPIGPRGTIWFTVNDLWTTPDSPTWSGSPAKANNPLTVGYPQYKGDPNRFQPVAPTGVAPILPWLFPQNTFTFNVPIKPVRGGDLYLQESDDNFNLTLSRDGDIWEFNAQTSKWNLTGVNIKGNTGAGGANAYSEWIRESALTDDIIYPKHVTGQDITRVLIGQYSNVYKMDNSTSMLTINTDLTHIAFNNPNVHNELVNPGDEELGATMTMTAAGDFILLGAAAGTSRQIIVQSNDTNIVIQAGGLNYLTYTQDPSGSDHRFDGGTINVYHPTNTGLQYNRQHAPTGPGTYHTITSSFDIVNGHAIFETGAEGYTGFFANFLNAPHLLLQGGINSIFKNVGVGLFAAGQDPLSKLSVRGNLSVGQNYSLLPQVDLNGAIFEGKVGIGTPTFPNGAAHNLQVNGAILLGSQYGFINDNMYWDQINSDWRNAYAGAGWMLRQDPTPSQNFDALYLYVWPHNATPNTPNTVDNYIAIDQRPGTALGKFGVGAPAWLLDSRVTINDTDATGIHLIRSNTLVPGSDNFWGSLATGARIWHSANAHTFAGDELVDGRFNIYQFNLKDFVIGSKTDVSLYPQNGTHHRIVIKQDSGFIGINTLRPKHVFTIKGRDYLIEPELNAPAPLGGFVFDPDEINMGTFEDRNITGLSVNTNPTGAVTHGEVNIQGASYIGFNAWFKNPWPANNPEVVYGDCEGQYGSAGAMIFADRNGNLHFANYEESGGAGGSGSGT